MKKLILLFLLLAGCTEKSLEFDTSGAAAISGSVTGYSASGVLAMACTNPTADLYSLDANGVRGDSALATTTVSSDGSFLFKAVARLGIDIKSSTVSYVIVINGCGEVLSRPVTDLMDQNVSRGSTLVEQVSLVEYTGKKKLSEAQKLEIAELIEKLNQASGASLNAVLGNLDAEASTKFQTIFNVPVTELQYARPTVNSLTAPTSVNELSAVNYAISASHWHPSYTVAYIWKKNGVQVSTSNSYNWTPSANEQGVYTIDLFVGKSDGGGGIDLTKAYITKGFSLTVANSSPAVVPTLTLTSTNITNNTTVSYSVDTGGIGNQDNCRTFTSLLLTADTPVAPLSSSDSIVKQVITCSVNDTQPMTYALGAGEGARSIRLWAVDSSGNISGVSESLSLTLDTVAPSISSFVLASGNNNIALPSTTFALSASDATSGNYQYRVSENSVFIDSGWVSYSTSGNFTLTSTNGNKTVYVWVKDNAANVSVSSSDSLTLDFGSPPTVAITGPAQGSSYSVGQTVPISWSCSSTSSLAANPISIKYTTDDGASFLSIATAQPNNLSATTGDFAWVLPGGVTVFRLLVECESLAGVKSSAYSGILNSSTWSIYAGDPWYGLTNVNAMLANLSSTGAVGIAADTNNNIYYIKGHSIMKIDAQSGLVTTWANTTGVAGSGVADGLNVSNPAATLNGPWLLGASSAGTSMFILSGAKIFSINFSNGNYTERANVAGFTVGSWYLARNGIFIFRATNTQKIYTVDITGAGATPVAIHGDGTCGTIAAPGTAALSSPIPVNLLAACVQDINLMANDDASKIWISPYSSAQLGYRLDKSGGTYNIGPNMAANYSGIQNCWFTRFDSLIYCRNRYVGRVIYPFNPTTEAWTGSNYTIPFTNNDDTGFLTIGSMNDKLITSYSLNTIQVHDTPSTGGWSTTVIAGQSLSIMGNGTSGLSAIGFQDPRDIKYNVATNSLFVRNITGHIRKIDLSTNPPTVSTFYQINMSLTYPTFSFRPDGSSFTTGYGCGRYMNQKYTFSGAILNWAYMLAGPCTTTGGSFPPASGTNATDGSANFSAGPGFSIPTGGYVLHSNGKVYFVVGGASAVSDIIMYESNGAILNQIAGKAGAAAYNAADHGNLALGASFCNSTKISMQEILSGAYAGDLLIMDCDRLRRISLVTEAATPKIYDVVALTLAGSYAAGTTPNDFIYDSTSESAGVLGSGKVFYVSGATVHKWQANGALNAATDSTYSFTGTTLVAPVRITLMPSDLLVLQASKSRILRVTP